MCRIVLKIVVFMTVSNCVYVTTAETGIGAGKINIKFSEEPTELKKILNCYYSDEPLDKWKNSTPLVFSADGNSAVHWSKGHVIQLRIVQYNVPEYFTWFNVLLKIRYSKPNPFLEEDIDGQKNYEKCLQLKETCDDILKINYTPATSHIFIIEGGFKKKLYDLKYKPDFNRGGSIGDIVHEVVYLVDWKTGCDAIIINSTTFAAGAITLPKYEANKKGTVLNEDNLYTIPTILPAKMKGKGTLNVPLIGGIVAVVFIALLAVLLMIWKCRIRNKSEPIYTEVQYAELELLQSSKPPPEYQNVTYSKVKGVIIPKQTHNEGRDPSYGASSFEVIPKVKQRTEGSISRPDPDVIVYSEIK